MQAPDMGAYLATFVGHTIRTMTGKPNAILSINRDEVLVGTDQSLAGAPVRISDVQAAADRLFRDGELEIDKHVVGYRSAFIGAILSTIAGTTKELNPRRIKLDRRNS